MILRELKAMLDRYDETCQITFEYILKGEKYPRDEEAKYAYIMEWYCIPGTSQTEKESKTMLTLVCHNDDDESLEETNEALNE